MNDAARPAQGGALSRHGLLLFVAAPPIILAYYEVKSGRRIPLVEHWGSHGFPYSWITSAVVVGAFIGFSHRLAARRSGLRVAIGSWEVFMVAGVMLIFAMAGWRSCQGVERGTRSVIPCYLGVMSGMLARPLALAVSSFRFMRQPPLLTGCVMKIADRALSFSIHRASEDLSMPIGALGTFPAAARTV